MINKLFISLTIMITATCMALGGSAEFEEDSMYHGFKLVSKKFVKEVNSECFYFEHVKSGARLLKIAADDNNKTFCISFKTTPECDCGTPHIMEHSVLNGSKNFPVKSPFDVLAKGSLNTFLNAMTGSHITLYPVASMNNKDYFNLMHVYLDAVFNPLIYDDPKILKQEGWHHELEAGDQPVEYKGVVYNEMKGAFSSPTRELDYQIYKNLFPDNCYGFSSGGYPAAIPDLTYEEFINFHRKYYHPSNSYIYLYGNADLDAELQFINAEYLSKYDKSDTEITIPLQKPFNALKEVTAPYPVAKDANTENQTFLTMNIVAGKNTDQSLVMALDILSDVLVNHESGAVRLALQEAGIGRDVSATVDDLKQNVFQIIVKNANLSDKDQFRQIVFNTLRTSAETGLDKKMIEGVINRKEFRLREGNDAQKGLTYNYRVLDGWFFANDPFLSLEYEKPLAEVKSALHTDYLEKVIKNYLIDNPHSLLLALEPRKGLENENQKNTEDKLAAYKESLDEQKTEALIEETQDLISYQKREDTPEALATIPLLNLSDISKDAAWFSVAESNITDVPLLYHQEFTNNVIYATLFFDAQVIPEKLIPYAALLTELLGSMNTENYTYGELDNELNIHTGGFNTSLTTYLKNRNDTNLLPKFIVSAKATNDKIDKLFELSEEILQHTKINDTERLRTVLTRHQSRVEARVKQDGFGYARTRQSSYCNNSGMFNELKGGLEYYWFITNLVNNFDAKADDIKQNLKTVSALLFSKENMVAGVTCNQQDLPAFKSELEKFISMLPATKVNKQTWSFNLMNKNEGILTASKVQYVIKGYDFKKLGYEYDGKLRVLSQILSRDYLQKQIRVLGGAYGGFIVISASGNIYFASYRDPNLGETLQNFDATPEFLKSFAADETTMTRFIIGTIARMDKPKTPSEKGRVAFRRYFENTDHEYVQQERDAVLSTTPEDIRKLEKLVAEVLQQNTYCVYGNEAKIRENKEQFGELIDIAPKKPDVTP